MHPRTQVHAELKGSSERKTYRVRQTTEKRVSSSENNISCYNTNEHQHRVRTETQKYISPFFFSFLMLDLLLRFRGFNSPGDVGIQTATVNKQDYPFGHASKSYHIGAGRGAGKRHQSNKVDRGQDAGSHGSWAHFYPQTNLPIFFLWYTVDFPFCLWSYCDVYVLGPKTVTLHRHETCTVSNIIPCQIFSIGGFLGRLHYTTRHFSVFLSETQNIISRENKTLQRLLLEKKKAFLPRAALIRLNLIWWR